jgi:ATP-dependent Lon protease
MTEPRRALVIDDEEIIRRCGERTLGPAGYVVDTAATGAEGLQMLREQRYDLALVDMKMPSMDGPEVVKQIRDLSPETKVIVITGYATGETEEMTAALGAAAYLEKPYTPQALLQTVEEILGEYGEEGTGAC